MFLLFKFQPYSARLNRSGSSDNPDIPGPGICFKLAVQAPNLPQN